MGKIKITGMSCSHCVTAVTRALNAVGGLKNVKVDLSAGEASFEEVRPVDMDAVKEAVKKAGYPAE